MSKIDSLLLETRNSTTRTSLKCMMKGKRLGMTNIKVLDRFLVIGDKKFNYKNFPQMHDERKTSWNDKY